MNFAKFLTTPVSRNTSGLLLLEAEFLKKNRELLWLGDVLKFKGKNCAGFRLLRKFYG